ncbi:neuropeptide CCHamide-1 receptor-like isoform X2 [Periplaneta americana]|uniref:neuropeptide CCHamide-1 receptor-like isoform X2 n=1 Tax=Periplaneta americana TaxID=6978 RepID=UPI0037E9B93F
MTINKVCTFILLIQLSMELQHTSPGSSPNNSHNGSSLQSNECHLPAEDLSHYGRQLNECFRTRHTDEETEGIQNHATNYKNQSDALTCMETERNKLLAEGRKYPTFAKKWGKDTWKFLSINNNTIGKIANDDMKICIEELKHTINKFKEFNKILNKFKLTSDNHISIESLNVGIQQKVLVQFQTFSSMFEQLYNIITLYDTLHNTTTPAYNLTEKYITYSDITFLEDAYEHLLVSRQLYETILEKATNLVDFKKENNIEDVFQNNFTRKLLNLEYWAKKLQNVRKKTEDFHKYITKEKFRIPLQHYIQPAVYGIIFIFGFVGNVVLAVIIIKYKDMRTTANMLLLNLAFGDMLNLLLNIPALHMYFVSTEWQLGETCCKMYRFFRQVGYGVSIYSIVVISVHKYVILFRLSKVRRVEDKISNLKAFLTVSCVWLIGCVLAIPHTLYAGIYRHNCYGFSSEIQTYYLKAVSLFDLISFCIIPLIMISISSTLSSRILEDSVKKVPGESMKTVKCIRARLISSKVLIAITVVSAISYVPFYLFIFCFSWLLEGGLEPRLHYVLFFFIYMLVFANSCFTPIALCITCKKFRIGFKRYLLCQKEQEPSAPQNQTFTKP